MPVLSLKDPRVWSIRRTDARLKDKKLLSGGQFSRVFESDHSNRVLKLTADRAHVEYLIGKKAPAGPFKPVVFEDYGVVGKTSQRLDVHLLEVEKLQSLRTGTHNYRMANALSNWCLSPHIPFPGPREILEGPFKPLSELFCDELLEFMKQVNRFSVGIDCSLDVKVSNFMERQDGAFIFSDPVCDQDALFALNYPQKGVSIS